MKKMKTVTSFVKSHAATAYELLADVRRAILEEPKRYNQEVWRIRGKRHIVNAGFDAPSCGTMACVAGWTVALAKPAAFKKMETWRIVEQALQLLSGPNDSDLRWEARDLFDGNGVFDEYEGDGDAPEPGTRAYARLGARRIARFMKEHKIKLRAVKLS